MGYNTIDAAMGLFPGQSLSAFPPDDPRRRVLEATDVVVVDEMSMLTAAKLFFIKYRMQTCTKAGMRPKVLVLVGDPAQLPPVCWHVLADEEVICSLCHLLHTPD
jgi:ATP-dependent exoDNAse (exonuclease V) alpha subunit